MSKEKKVEQQYLVSPINNKVLNYNVYVMVLWEKILYMILFFIAGGAVGLIFYGGLFKSDGVTTTATYISNGIVFCGVGLLACKIFMPLRTEQLRKKRIGKLRKQFVEFLSALTTSLSSGMNVTDSLYSALQDLTVQFTEKSLIVQEVNEILAGIENNVDVETMLQNFGERSGISDVSNFAKVFSVCFRTGGNLKEIVRRTSDVISEKVAISEEIETKLTSNKTQFKAMNVIPIILVLMLRTMSSQFAASFASIIGVIAMTIAVGIFIAAYRIGTKISDIKG